MTSDLNNPDYFFGHTDAEHERLIRQALRLAPVTEKFFRDAGIAPGHRILELGSGLGDVTMLVARIVGRMRSGVNMEMGPALHNAFEEAGLPAPRMRLEMGLGRDPDFTRWVSDLLRSSLPQIQKLNFSQEALGDLDPLQKRLQEEVAVSNTVVPSTGLVAAWCRKSVD